MTEGDNATLTCEASGHPSPRILWRREDGDHILLRVKSQGLQKGKTHNFVLRYEINFLCRFEYDAGFLCKLTLSILDTIHLMLVG